MLKQTPRSLRLFILSSAVFLTVLDIFIVNGALPVIKSGVGGSDADAQLVIVLYVLGYAIFLITGGRLGDYYGKKRMFIWAMLAFVITSAGCGVANTAWQLNAARFLQGISAACLIPQSISFIQHLFPEHDERTKAFAIYGSIGGAASVIGQFLGGLLPDQSVIIEGWRLIFLINVPIGIVSAILAFSYMPRDRGTVSGKIDRSGIILLTCALISLIYPLVSGVENNWPMWSFLMLGLAVMLLAVFWFVQKKKLIGGRQPLIDMRLFGFRDFNIGLAAVLFYFMVQDSYFLINVFLFQSGFGFTASHTGILFVYQGIGFVVASVFATVLIPKFGKKMLQAGVVVMISGLSGHILCLDSPAVPAGVFKVVLFVYGLGCGTVLPSLLSLALKSIPAEFAGVASGMYATFQQTAIALGVGVTGGIFFDHLGNGDSAERYLSAYRYATLVNIGFLILVAIFLYLLPEQRKKRAAN
ncbi:MFS transporter [Pedobacter sp. SYP-B3415]|uniref:MFS transporter n=1 Tax=Pedobacter sp. SYP-B3415 TaxID=2496641 RepID=UPI00101CBDDA|nr:MFS transporter [Pedobacter sp. SYP-B3415]